MSIFDSEKKMILLKKNLEACFALGIETPWGGTVVPFYEVGRERSEPGNP